MIQRGTKLKVADNTGAKIIQCFGICGASKKRYARIGDVIVAAVKDAEPGKEIEKGDKVYAVIVRQKYPFRQKSGIYIKFDENAAVILQGKKSKDPKGNRIFGPIPRVLKEKGFDKIVSLSEATV